MRYLILAALFICALAFQMAVSYHDLRLIWIGARHFHPKILADWAILLNLHFLTPFVCLLLGFYVAKARIWDARAWLMLAVLVSFSIESNGSNWPDHAMTWQTPLRHAALVYRSAGLMSWPVWMMVFAIYFPDRPAWDLRRPAIKWILLMPFGAICLTAVTLRVVMNEVPALNPALTYPQFVLTEILFWGGELIFVAVLLAKFLRARTADESRRLKVLLIGLALSFLPALALDTLAKLIGMREDDFPAWILVPAVSCLLLFPLTLAYVILVQRALDVGVILRAGLQYAMARRTLVAFQFLASIAVILLIAFFSARLSFTMRVLVTGIGINVIFFTSILIHAVGNWLDRRFFREAYNTEQILARLSERIESLTDLPALIRIVAERVSEALHISSMAVFLREHNTFRPAYVLGLSQPAPAFTAASSTVSALQQERRAVPVYLDDRKSWGARLEAEERRELELLQAQVLVPMLRQNQLLGFFSLGPRAADAPYSPRDLDLLQSVAQQTALGIENGRLTSAVAAEIANREIMERELAIAHEVQQRLLPRSCPRIRGIEGFGTCRPAREVGGDYFDFLELPGEQLGIAIGDVAGKGIPAALLMASLQASLRGQTLSGCERLETLMINVNRLIYAASPENRYATFFYAQYDPATHRLLYVNAGHNPPIVLRGSDLERLEAGGPPIGLLPHAPYVSGAVDLACGDLVVLFTDGISEAMNSRDEEWGEANLIATLCNSPCNQPGQVAAEIFRAADAFAAGAPQHDDMTIVVLRVS